MFASRFFNYLMVCVTFFSFLQRQIPIVRLGASFSFSFIVHLSYVHLNSTAGETCDLHNSFMVKCCILHSIKYQLIINPLHFKPAILIQIFCHMLRLTKFGLLHISSNVILKKCNHIIEISKPWETHGVIGNYVNKSTLHQMVGGGVLNCKRGNRIWVFLFCGIFF